MFKCFFVFFCNSLVHVIIQECQVNILMLYFIYPDRKQNIGAHINTNSYLTMLYDVQ